MMFRNMILVSIVLVYLTLNVYANGVESVFLKYVDDTNYNAIIVRSNGDEYFIEYGIGVLSIWRYENV